MELYFLRHAIAASKDDPKYQDDSLRPLTVKGRKTMQEAARGMKNLGLQFDAVLSSPYVRARQTAEIVMDIFKLKMSLLHLTNNLLPPATIANLRKEIKKQFPQATKFLLVGHEPHLTSLISALLGCPGVLNIDFKKSGLCCFTTEPLDAGLQWLLTPEQLGILGKIRRHKP
jgi:phosphohistidine phosphatase